MRDDSDQIVGVRTTARDVTEARRIQRELARSRDDADTAHRELEAFSNSVANDLRAPLRTIDGFSRALLEDYGSALDSGGLRYLGIVRESTQLMTTLIDDILELSRVNRATIITERVDLSALARASYTRCAQADPGRPVEVRIGEGIVVEGDLRLLGMAIDHLMENAWKFTAGRDPARIEFGASTKDGRPMYFVRDNGAGFDMTYVHKLFGMFQRLHSTADFEGTGMGLASVQRIVQRHGGRIWGTGEVDRGATFYFTLGEREARP
jgi:light-regulated signal transduction histidine kinase (bacteriophytochrome)